MKLILAVVLGILLVYSWNLFLAVAQFRQALIIFYIIAGFTVSALHKTVGKSGLNEFLFSGLVFGAAISLMDIIVSSIITINSLGLLLLDSGIKISTIILGSIIYWACQKKFYSTRKMLFTSLGVLLRRLTAAIIDAQIILLVIAGLTAAFSPFKMSQEIVLAVTVIIIFSYKAVHEAQYRQTPGKKLMGIHVNCNPATAIIRNMPIILLFAAPYTGWVVNVLYLVILIDIILFFTGKRLFDWIARTSVN